MGDIFDQVTGEKTEGDIFDRVGTHTTSTVSPVDPPKLRSPKIPMHGVDLLSGDEHQDPGTELANTGRGLLKNAYQISAPGIAISMLNRFKPGLAEKIADKVPDVMHLRGAAQSAVRSATPLKELPTQIMENGLPMMVGEEEPPNPRPRPATAAGTSARPAAPPVRPTPGVPATAADAESTMGSRTVEVAKRRIGNLPGVKIAKDVNYIVRGGESETAPAKTAAKPKPEPVPETNGIPHGTMGPGPLSLRGKMIPPEPEPVFPKERQGPEAPDKHLLQGNALREGGKPSPEPTGAALGRIPAPKVDETPQTPLGPEKPPDEVLQANSLREGGKPPAPNPADALGRIPPPNNPPEPVVPAALPKAQVSKTLDRTLTEAVGNKPGTPPKAVIPGVKLRDQMQGSSQPAALPPGHTAVESSAINSFKYDAETQELHVTTKNGTTYVSGEVTPDQADAFAKAPSKGQAWKQVRDNSPLVAKITPKGERIPVVKTDFRSASPTDVAPGSEPTPRIPAPAQEAQPTPAKTKIGKPGARAARSAPGIPVPADDLQSQLEQSLAAVKRNRVARPVGRDIESSARAIDDAGQQNEGTIGKGAKIPESSEASAQAPSGAKTAVKVPGSDHVYPAAYQIRELADVRPSHSGINFNPTENYELVNDRNYSNQVNQGKIVTNSAPGKFDPAYHITDNPDATNGPIVIDSAGHALGGNGRAMILQRVYKYNPEGAAAYRNLLAQKAQQFGLDPAAIERMQQPVLVREIGDADLAGPASKQEAITDFNKTGTAEMTPAERAIADSRRISQRTLDLVAARIEGQGAEATLSDIMRGGSGAEILDRLIDDGVLSPQERAAFANKEGLTEAGRDRISKLLVGRFFRDPAQLDTIPPSIRTKVESMAAPLARVDGVEGWDLTPKLHEALDLLEEARTHGITNLEDLLSQQGLFGESKYSPDALTLAKRLQQTPARAIAKSVRQYAQDAADSQRPLLLGDKVTPDQAFQDAFRATP